MKKQKGLTLVELMISIVFIGVMVAFLVFMKTGNTEYLPDCNSHQIIEQC